MINLELKLIGKDKEDLYTFDQMYDISLFVGYISQRLELQYRQLLTDGKQITLVPVKNSEPYKDTEEMFKHVYNTGILFVSDICHPSYCSNEQNLNTRFFHDLFHIIGYLEHNKKDFDTFSELYVYKLTTDFVLSLPVSAELKTDFLNFHYADFVGQTILYHQTNEFMTEQKLLVPFENNTTFLDYHSDRNIKTMAI